MSRVFEPGTRLAIRGPCRQCVFCVPRKWTCWRCSDCFRCTGPAVSIAGVNSSGVWNVLYPSSSAAQGQLRLAQPLAEVATAACHGYTQWRFSSRQLRVTWIGVAAVAAWPLKIRLDQEYRHMPRLPEGGGALDRALWRRFVP